MFADRQADDKARSAARSRAAQADLEARQACCEETTAGGEPARDKLLSWKAARAAATASCIRPREQETAERAAEAAAVAKERPGESEERQAQAALLRDLFNPFRVATLDPSCLTPSVLALARAAYDHRSLPAGTLDNAHLAILGDALEEAGCTDDELLGHLRSPGPHVRGCFALDAVLGRS